jgi:hypothetical protein
LALLAPPLDRMPTGYNLTNAEGFDDPEYWYVF